MRNRILDVQVQTQRLTPMEAELCILVRAETMTPATELRGRFVGPKCPGVTTVEVAYPLRPFADLREGLMARVVIPEPNRWEEQCPFVYDGVVELWQDGQCCDVRHVWGYKLLAVKDR
jgi:hypothetical protein